MLSVLFLLSNLHFVVIWQTGPACDGIWMQLMKSVLNFISSQFLSAMYHTLPTCWYEIYQKSINDKYFIIAAEFASCIYAYSASLRFRL